MLKMCIVQQYSYQTNTFKIYMYVRIILYSCEIKPSPHKLHSATNTWMFYFTSYLD